MCIRDSVLAPVIKEEVFSYQKVIAAEKAARAGETAAEEVVQKLSLIHI